MSIFERHRIALLTDSTCDILPELASQYAICIIPAYVIWGEVQYRDRVDLQAPAFYQRLVEDPVYPKSAHPTPGDFLTAFAKARDEGAEEIVVITVNGAGSSPALAGR